MTDSEQARQIDALLSLADDYAQKFAANLGWAVSARVELKRKLVAAMAAASSGDTKEKSNAND